MKKFLTFSLITLLSMFVLSSKIKGNTNYRFEIQNQDVKFSMGMEHRKINGKMTLNGEESTQYYNYLSTGVGVKDDYHIVTFDNFSKNTYGINTVAGFIENYEKLNLNMEVIAAMNGDRFSILEDAKGQSSNTYIRDGKVPVPGSNDSLAFVTYYNGKNSFQRIFVDGNELIVYNKYGEIKYREKVDKLNQEVTNENQVGVYFENYIGEVNNLTNTLLISGTDIKRHANRQPTHNNFYTYGEGNLSKSSIVAKVPKQHFVVKSNKLEEIIEEEDLVLFQDKIRNFENVQFAISTYRTSALIINNEIYDNKDLDRHPRSAIDIKENGEIFFLVVDGRDRATPKDGVKLPELAHLMKSYGALDSYNFDGGGSSTLMLKNSNTEGTVLERFDVLNTPSEGYLRSVSNGFLIVKGELPAKPVDIRELSDREVFPAPSNIYIDNNLNLNFDPVDNASYYEIFINNIKIETTSNVVPLKGLLLGDNFIEVRVKGTKDYETSLNTITINYKVSSKEVDYLLRLLKRFT